MIIEIEGGSLNGARFNVPNDAPFVRCFERIGPKVEGAISLDHGPTEFYEMTRTQMTIATFTKTDRIAADGAPIYARQSAETRDVE